MKLLLVTNIFPPIIGGPATFIDNLAHDFTRRGATVTVVCSSFGEDPNDDARPFRVLRCDISNRYRYEIVVRAVLAKQLARHRAVLVNGLETYVEPLARRLRREYVIKVVGDPVWEAARNEGSTDLPFDEFQAADIADPRTVAAAAKRNRYLRSARTVVTPSDYLGDVVARWGIPRSGLRTIPNGVVPNPSIRPSPRRPDETMRILFVGRLTNWKGIETVLLALPQLPGVQLTIVGSGPEGPLLRELTRQLALDDRVTFTGRLSSVETEAQMSAAHVLVLPSCYEGLSHTLLEAGERGLAAVASDIGGNRAVIQDDENGLLVPYGDTSALVATLRRLRDDEHLRIRLATALQKTAHSHDFSTTADSYFALLQESAT